MTRHSDATIHLDDDIEVLPRECHDHLNPFWDPHPKGEYTIYLLPEVDARIRWLFEVTRHDNMSGLVNLALEFLAREIEARGSCAFVPRDDEQLKLFDSESTQ